MTGPGEGKIPVAAKVLVLTGSSWKPVECSVYVHVKGYSQARVTHVDVEADELNELVLSPEEHSYATAIVAGERLTVSLWKPRKTTLLVASRELSEALGPLRSTVYVGGKQGGIFIGFRREYVRKLEDFARKKGYSI